MTTNIAKLKNSKGAPPAAETAADVITDDPRAQAAALRPLQIRVPVSVFEEFSAQAGREYNFSHGAKKKLFLKIWEAYKAQNM
jgi:hypothetical protein